MGYTQRYTHELAQINLGVRLLCKALRARTPDDFECWFMVDGSEYAVGWALVERGEIVATDDVRAPKLDALLLAWQRIDWEAERCAAMRGSGMAGGPRLQGSEGTALAATERDRAAEVTAARKVPEGARTEA